jgi:hypothetical protein
MPHMNALSQRFKDRGVIFIAQDVMEDAKQKVQKFLAAKGKGMDFRIAVGGEKGSDFDKRWTAAAGVSSIPQTFIIQNNILVWQTNPTMLNEEILQLLIDGKFTIEKAEAIISKSH